LTASWPNAFKRRPRAKKALPPDNLSRAAAKQVMKMPLDAVCLTALKNELAEEIGQMIIDKIQQPERDVLLFSLRGNKTIRLLISAGSGNARLHVTESAFENPSAPPMFCMLLRKHLAGAVIREIRQPPLERVVDIILSASDALGVMSEKHLIVELIGRASNIILTGQDGLIIDCLRRVGGELSEKRQVLPGLKYRLPPTADRRNFLEMTGEEFLCLLHGAPPEKTAEKWLTDLFLGLSPLIARELVHRAYGDYDRRIFEIEADDGGRSLSDALEDLAGHVKSGAFQPVLLSDQTGKPRDFTYMAITQYGAALKQETVSGFSAMLDRFYTQRDKTERNRQRSSALTKSVRTARDRQQRKLELQRKELKTTKNRERLRQFGDLITANLHRMEKGMTALRTEDFYSEDGGACEIRLDPLKTPQQNAAKYYKDYTKSKNAEVFLTEQIKTGTGAAVSAERSGRAGPGGRGTRPFGNQARACRYRLREKTKDREKRKAYGAAAHALPVEYGI
jgi:predicted ribosome quality control (RQC) complex YloA/Tae2 family protein